MYLFPILLIITTIGNWIFFNSRYNTQCSLSASYLWSTTIEYLLLFTFLWFRSNCLFVCFITFSPSIVWSLQPNQTFLNHSWISILTVHWLSIWIASFITPLLNQIILSGYEMIHYDHRNTSHLKRFLFLLSGLCISNWIMILVLEFLHPEIFY